MTGKSATKKAVLTITIKFKLGHETKHVTEHNHYGLRNIIQEQHYNRFDQNLRELVAMKFQMENTQKKKKLRKSG